MTSRAAKILVRIAGTLAGLFGLFMFWFGAFFLFTSAQQGKASLGLGLLFFIWPLLIAWYCLYAGWLVWFRFSPLAVRHVCGLVAFATFMGLFHFMEPSLHGGLETEPLWMPVTFFGSLLLLLLLYRVASERLSRLLFPLALSSEGQT